MSQLKDKVAIVTGGSRGIGQSIAEVFAREGATVVICGRKQNTLDEVAAGMKGLAGRVVAMACHVGKLEELQRLVDTTARDFGRIDILVNNAGTIQRSPAADYSWEDWSAVLETNLSSVFRLSQLAGRQMMAQGGGKIINIASLLTFQGGVFVPSYAAAKGGVGQLTKAFANEWASRGINVNAIAPGYMETDNTAALRADPVRSRQILERIPAGRWGTPSDLGGAAIFLASRASDYMHGHILVVDGGWMSR
jgi:2-dehydro-3-deoxy-D-gluconate 5-dehydrogenase